MTQQQSTEVQEVTTESVPSSQRVTQKTRVISDTPHEGYQTKKAIFRSYQIIWYIVGVIEVLLAFRLVLKLIGASTSSGFTNFIYTISSPFAQPFSGILRTTTDSNIVFEWSTLIAMAVYVVLAYGLVELLQLVKPTTPQEVDKTIDNQ